MSKTKNLSNNPAFKRWFTAFRFEGCEQSPSEQAQATFRRLYQSGLTPAWGREAQSRTHPSAACALLIQLPKVEAKKFQNVNQDK